VLVLPAQTEPAAKLVRPVMRVLPVLPVLPEPPECLAYSEHSDPPVFQVMPVQMAQLAMPDLLVTPD